MASDATINRPAADVAAEVLPAIAARRTTRRRMLAEAAAVTGVAVAGGTLLGRPSRADAVTPKGLTYGARGSRVRINDNDILNFALNLEYLEAEFYQVAAFGTPLTAGDITGTGVQGVVNGGSKATFTDPIIQQYATEIATDELNHVRFLRKALGSQAVARPSLDISGAIGGAFSMAAASAGILTDATTQAFNPYTVNTLPDGTVVPADYSFLLGAYIFEDVGVTAYQGGAPYINNPTYLGAAASIMAVEAQHAGEVRSTLYARATTLNIPALLSAPNQISALRNTLSQNADGVAGTDEGIAYPDANSTANIVPANGFGQTFARTFGAVLNIVYGGGYSVLTQSGAGLFFPSGMNGRIH